MYLYKTCCHCCLIYLVFGFIEVIGYYPFLCPKFNFKLQRLCLTSFHLSNRTGMLNHFLPVEAIVENTENKMDNYNIFATKCIYILRSWAGNVKFEPS